MANRALAFVIIIVFTGISVKAQVSGFNMMEYHNGTLPEDTTKNYSTLFNKFQLNYVSENLYVNGRLETFNSPVDERNYNKITKYVAEYTDKGLTLKIGTFNETLAKGVLLRSYEIPSAVLEDKGFRVRQSFNRDILGVAGKYNTEHFGISLLRGSPLLNLLPPTFPENERRPDIIEAIRSNISWFNQSLEIGLLRNIVNQTVTNYPWLAINVVVNENYSYFIQFTHQTDTIDEFTKINMQESYGFYSSFGASFNTLSFNLELKNYNKLVLGSGYNDPPALIKEHSSRLLNRSSHVLLPQNEKGYQFDVFYSFPDDSRLNFNNALAINEFSSKYVYTSYYLEYYKPFETISFKVFGDYTNDEFKQEKNRITAGGVFDVNIQSFFGELQYEHQIFDRYETSIYNRVISLEIGKSPKYAVGSTLEISNDPFQLRDDNNTRTWLGFYASFKYSRNNNFQLFVGERRGGPACTAGICYEVLDFKGVELRWNAKF